MCVDIVFKTSSDRTSMKTGNKSRNRVQVAIQTSVLFMWSISILFPFSVFPSVMIPQILKSEKIYGKQVVVVILWNNLQRQWLCASFKSQTESSEAFDSEHDGNSSTLPFNKSQRMTHWWSGDAPAASADLVIPRAFTCDRWWCTVARRSCRTKGTKKDRLWREQCTGGANDTI